MMTGAAAVGQLLQLIALLALTRLYSPAAFGELTIATTASAFFAVVIGLQLPFAITSASGPEARRDIMAVIQANALGSFLIALPIVVATGESYALAALVGAGVCVGNMLKGVAVTGHDEKTIAYYYIWRATIICSLQFTLFELGPSGLAVGLAAGEIIASLILAATLRVNLLNSGKFRWSSYLSTIKSHLDFTFFGVLQELVAIMVVLVPFVVADWLYTAQELGNYGMAYRLTWGPVSIIGVNVGWIFLGILGKGDRRAVTILGSYVTLSSLLSIALIGGLAGGKVAQFATAWHSFGAWQLAVKLAPILAWAALFFLASVPYRQVIRVGRRQSTQLSIDGAALLGMLAVGISRPENVTAWVATTSALTVLQNLAIMVYGVAILRQGRLSISDVS